MKTKTAPAPRVFNSKRFETLRHDMSGKRRVLTPIVPGQEVFSPEQMRLLLGGISRSTYFELKRRGLLKFSRLDKGKQVVHTLQQYRSFIEYLNTEGVVNGNAGGRGESEPGRPRETGEPERVAFSSLSGLARSA